MHSETIVKYQLLYEKLIANEGKPGAILRLKGYFQSGKRVALNLPPVPLPFTKSDKEGFPKAVSFLKPLLKGSMNERRFALTVLNLYRLIHLAPNPDLESITDPGPELDPVLLKEFEAFATLAKPRLPALVIDENPEFHQTGAKSGPNGPALLSSHLDAVAFVKDESLLNSYN